MPNEQIVRQVKRSSYAPFFYNTKEMKPLGKRVKRQIDGQANRQSNDQVYLEIKRNNGWEN